MRLVNASYGLDFMFSECVAEILILENPLALRNIASDLWNQCAGNEGKFVLSDNSILKPEKHMMMIINPFELDFQNRKITTTLFSKMAKIGNEKIIEKNNLNSQLITLIEEIADSVNYQGITFQLDFDWNDLFKIYGVKIEGPDNFIQRLIEYMKVMNSLCGIRIFCCLNLKQYLSQQELLILYQESAYNKIYLLLIESYESYKVEKYENITIVDKDLCVIKKI